MPTLKSIELPLNPSLIFENLPFGRLYVSSFSATMIPRVVLLRAIRSHGRSCNAALPEVAFETLHAHEGTLFHIRTDVATGETTVQLHEER